VSGVHKERLGTRKSPARQVSPRPGGLLEQLRCRIPSTDLLGKR
jgi:hypothetical protein